MYFESEYGCEKLFWKTCKSTPVGQTPKVCPTFSFILVKTRPWGLLSFLLIQCALHMLFFNKYRFRNSLVIMSKLLSNILFKCTPNTYFRSKYMVKEKFLMILKINPFFWLKAQNHFLKLTNERLQQRLCYKLCEK